MIERTIRRRGFLWFPLLPLCTAPLPGSDATRRLSGVVSGADGKPVAGAVVKLKNLITLHIRSFISLKDGSYRFAGLNPDIEYEVFATYEGATSSTKKLSKFDSATEASIDLVLK